MTDMNRQELIDRLVRCYFEEEEKLKNNYCLNSLDDISNINFNTNFVPNNRRYSFSSTSSKMLKTSINDNNNLIFSSLQQ